jgi:hypothetical protein
MLQGTELFSNFLKLQVNGTTVQVFAQTFSNLISGRLFIGVLRDITSKRVGTYTRINGFNYHDDHHVEWRNLCYCYLQWWHGQMNCLDFQAC